MRHKLADYAQRVANQKKLMINEKESLFVMASFHPDKTRSV